MYKERLELLLAEMRKHRWETERGAVRNPHGLPTLEAHYKALLAGEDSKKSRKAKSYLARKLKQYEDQYCRFKGETNEDR